MQRIKTNDTVRIRMMVDVPGLVLDRSVDVVPDVGESFIDAYLYGVLKIHSENEQMLKILINGYDNDNKASS